MYGISYPCVRTPIISRIAFFFFCFPKSACPCNDDSHVSPEKFWDRKLETVFCSVDSFKKFFRVLILCWLDCHYSNKKKLSIKRTGFFGRSFWNLWLFQFFFRGLRLLLWQEQRTPVESRGTCYWWVVRMRCDTCRFLNGTCDAILLEAASIILKYCQKF